MTEKDLNMLLIEEFPDIKDSFDDETSWQDGLNTGCTVTYADVFVPYIVKSVLSNSDERIKKIFNYIEKLVLLNDEYVKQVIMLSIFDPLFYDYADIDWCKYFNDGTKKLYDGYKK